MQEIVGAALLILVLLLPIVGYSLVGRRPNHTRANLVTGAALGGGVSGGLIAVWLSTQGGGSDGVVYAFWALFTGALIGFVGVLAQAFGSWLSRRP
jgi:hypothetical protein